MTPPISGCNGIWAVENPFINCGGPYSMNSCAVIDRIVGDTLFFNLCSLPCDFIILNDSGNVCFTCSILVFTGVENLEDIVSSIMVYPNPASDQLHISSDFVSSHALTFPLFDLQGRLMSSLLLNDGVFSRTIKLPNLSSGLYFWSVSDHTSKLKAGKVLLNPAN